VGPSLLTLSFELAVHIGVLAGFLALTAARILLLLARLLTTALLLARLLTRVLVLLARFLGRIIHFGISLVERSRGQRKAPRPWLRGNSGSDGMIARQSRVGIVTWGTAAKNYLCTSPPGRSQRCCRPRFQTVRKRYDASDKMSV
jgi:hypothetical protein